MREENKSVCVRMYMCDMCHKVYNICIFKSFDTLRFE